MADPSLPLTPPVHPPGIAGLSLPVSRGELCECHDCGLFQRVARLRPGQVAECERCAAVLRRRRRNSLGTTLALACSGLLLLLTAGISPLMGFRLAGQERLTTLVQLPSGFEAQSMPLLAVVVGATTLLAPFLRLSLTILLLAGLRRLSRGTLVVLARLRDVLTPWAMIEVFMLGLFVAYTRLEAKATVMVGGGVWALGALMLVTAWADTWLDEHALWTAIGRRGRPAAPAPEAAAGRLMGCDCCHLVSRGRPGLACPRCDTPLRDRKPQPISRSWALMIAAGLLYIPANAYPILTLTSLGHAVPSTILGGVQELIEYRMWPLAALVFIASVLVPMLKLLGLGTLLVLAQRGSPHRLRDRTRLFRLVDFIGRWSMIDVFMLSVLTTLVQMGAVTTVTPGPGAVAFACVVVLTMLSALCFDPRVMWDAAQSRSAAEPAGATLAAPVRG